MLQLRLHTSVLCYPGGVWIGLELPTGHEYHQTAQTAAVFLSFWLPFSEHFVLSQLKEPDLCDLQSAPVSGEDSVTVQGLMFPSEHSS